MTDVDLMLRFLIQLLVVLGVCKVVGWIGQKFLGQTQVVMEMLAGVILGPSVFGLLSPKGQEWLFPGKATYLINGVETSAKHPSMFVLYTAAQLGLVLYMFLVGLEFNIKLVQNKAKGAIMVSLAGIILPFILGAGLALYTQGGNWGLFTPNIGVGSACLYFGAAMCITAFPMLARIIYERNIAGTAMGTLALGAGATDDAAAWSLLAVVLAFSKGNSNYALFSIGGGALFGFVMIKYASRIFAKLAQKIGPDGEMPQAVFVSSMILLFAGAYFTDAIGIYAVFGAFIIGAAMPRGRFVKEMQRKLESVTVGILLPFFFVYSGLNTKIALIDSPAMWALAIAVTLAAIVGKGLGCTLAARACGEGWKESWAIGTLMNARGLMELIILNIGLQQGVITQRLYTIMVIMAIVTTLMASPIFEWLYKKYLGTALEEERMRNAAAMLASCSPPEPALTSA